MAKKMAVVLFSLFLVLSLAACKGNVNTDTQEDSSSSNANVTENSSALAETSSTNLTTETQPTEETATQKKAEESTTAKETTTAKKTNVATAKETTTQKTTTATQKTTTTTKKQNTTTTTTTTTKKTTTTTKKTTTTTKKPATTAPNYNVNSSNSNVKEVYNLVNQERSKNGLSKLSYRNDLQNAANTRAKEIVSKWGHTRPDGRSGLTAISDAGISYNSRGENIGKTDGTNSDMMKWWMNSTEHRNNILSKNFTGIAVGCYEENGVKYYVQLFVS